MLAKSKLSSIETLTSKALIACKISHEEYNTIIYEEKKCRGLKKDIRMMRSQTSDVKKDKLIE